MFAPDEAGHRWRDLDRDGVDDLNADTFGYGNNWWADWDDTTALLFYLIVGAGGLVATLATRFEPRTPAERRTMLRPAA